MALLILIYYAEILKRLKYLLPISSTSYKLKKKKKKMINIHQTKTKIPNIGCIQLIVMKKASYFKNMLV